MGGWAEALAWLEASPAGDFVRGTGPWTYPVVNLTHIVGIALLFGAIAVLDLRLLGLWRNAPPAAIAQPATQVAGVGLLLAVPSGVLMLAARGDEYAANPFIPIKFAAIALALVNLMLLRRSPAWRRLGAPEGRTTRRLALGAGFSLSCWLAAIAAGRMIAYWAD